MRETVEEGFVPDFHFCAIAVVKGEVSEVAGFPFQEDWCVGFGLEEDDEEEDEGGDDEGDPFGPAPGDEGGFADEAADYGATNGAHEGSGGEDGEGVDALHGTPEIGDGPAGAGQRSGSKTASYEAESELGADVRRESGGHDKDHVEGQCGDIDRIAADSFGDWSCEESSYCL